MTAELCPHHSGIVAQFDAICKKLVMIQESLEKQITMHEKAVEVAKIEMERRLEGMNEFRQQLSQQAQTFISKTEVDLRLREMDTKYAPLLNLANERRGSKKWEDHIIEVLIGLAVIVVVWIMTKGI